MLANMQAIFNIFYTFCLFLLKFLSMQMRFPYSADRREYIFIKNVFNINTFQKIFVYLRNKLNS